MRTQRSSKHIFIQKRTTWFTCLLGLLILTGYLALCGNNLVMANQNESQSDQTAEATTATEGQPDPDSMPKDPDTTTTAPFLPPCICPLIELEENELGQMGYYATVHPTPSDCDAGVYAVVVYGNFFHPADCQTIDECIDITKYMKDAVHPFPGHSHADLPKNPNDLIKDEFRKRTRVIHHDRTRLAFVSDAQTSTFKALILYSIRSPVSGRYRLVNFGYELPLGSALLLDSELLERTASGTFERDKNPMTGETEEFIGKAKVVVDGQEVEYSIILKKKS